MPKVKSVDAYIENTCVEAHPILQELREIIKTTIPDVEEGISWGVPFYKYHGLLAGFATYKNHVSFGLCDILLSNDRQMLEKQGYKTGKKTIQIKFDQEVPISLIKKILKAKGKMNETQASKESIL